MTSSQAAYIYLMVPTKILLPDKVTFKGSGASIYLGWGRGHHSSHYIKLRRKGSPPCEKTNTLMCLVDIWRGRVVLIHWTQQGCEASVLRWISTSHTGKNTESQAPPYTNWIRISRGWSLDINIFQSFPGDSFFFFFLWLHHTASRILNP